MSAIQQKWSPNHMTQWPSFKASMGIKGIYSLLTGKVFLMKTKNLPFHILESWFKCYKNRNSTSNFLQTNQGGELAGSQRLQEMALQHVYTVETTSADSSHQNRLAKFPHCCAAESVRALLHNANLPNKYWPYALVHWVYLSNIMNYGTTDVTSY